MFVSADISNPNSISDLTFFLISSLPDNYGAALYYAVYPYVDLQFIGAIANSRPSDIFRTGWSVKEDVNEAKLLKLVVKIEPLSNLETLVKNTILNDS